MMDKDSFLNAEIPQWNGLNCNAEQSFLNSNSYIHHNSHFESAFSSMVSSPAASTAFPAAATTAMAAGPCMGANNDCSNDSCYNSTLNSSKLHLHNIDHIKMANLGNPVPLATQPSFTADPGFRVRAAKFSCSDCSFSDGTTRLGLKNSPLMGNGKFLRAFGSPSIAQTGLPVGNKNLIQAKKEMSPVDGGIDKKLSKLSGFAGNPSEESFVSERIPSGETGWKTSNEMNFRKRKEILRGKMKADGSILDKGVPGDEDTNPERSNPTENCKNENGDSDNETKKQLPNQKPSKNYIHVRARRGEATDSHSLAERVRRQKISQRMKLLQDLVPGCNKVMGKAVLLDEIINYVESLQHQVKFLAMKLASVNPGLDFKNIYYLDSSASSFYGHRSHNTDVFSRKSAGDPIDAPLYYNMGVQLSYVDGLSENFPQFPDFCEDDLHSIVPMGLGQNPVRFPVENQTSIMETEGWL